MTKAEIEKAASRLLQDVMAKYNSKDEWDNRSLREMIDKELVKYNKEIGDAVYAELTSIGMATMTKTLPVAILTRKELSSMLYKNAKKVSRETYAVLKEANKTQKTANELARLLYDGYDVKDEAVLKVVEKFPKYLKDTLKGEKELKELLKQVNKLKTRPLKIAMNGIIDSINKMDMQALEKALGVALEEKSRYYASRIAVTETQRAKSLGNAVDMILDDDIELVQFEMSSLHKIFDICDYYANIDVGYGRGIVPKRDMVSLPLHPHCRCKYRPKYQRIKKKKVKDPTDKLMKSLRKDQQRDILGSYDKVADYKKGKKILDIFNEIRPKYPITKVVDLL